MGKFASPEKQAKSVIDAMVRSKVIVSLGTSRNYTAALTRVAEFAKAERINGGLRGITPELIHAYLEQRGEAVGQKQLDMERQASQAMMRHVTNWLSNNESLTVIKSEHQQILKSRSYTPEQISMVSKAQKESNSLATRIAYAAGLRAHELLTLRPVEERAASKRKALVTKFSGREGKRYTVHGKGGLVREVLIPGELARELELTRLDSPIRVTDREIHYQQHYKIAGGKSWSNSYSKASKRALTWSAGAHGLRHTYAQERMHELLQCCLTRSIALETVSQEMGHFRPDITEVYLR